MASPQTALVAVAGIALALTGVGVQASLASQKAEYHRRQQVGRQMLRDLEEDTTLAEHFLASDAENTPWLADGVAKGIQALEPIGALDDPDWHDRPEFVALIPEEKERLKDNVVYLAFLLSRAVAQTKLADPKAGDLAAITPRL